MEERIKKAQEELDKKILEINKIQQEIFVIQGKIEAYKELTKEELKKE